LYGAKHLAKKLDGEEREKEEKMIASKG